MSATTVRLGSLSALFLGAALSLTACTITDDTSTVPSDLFGPSPLLGEGDVPYTTPCGDEGGPGCLVGWCLDAAYACPPGYTATCDPLFLTTSCQYVEPTVPVPPFPTQPPVILGDATHVPVPPAPGDAGVPVPRMAQQGVTSVTSPEVGVPAASPDMTGWFDDLGTGGKVNIKTPDGSLDAKYTVVKKEKGALEIKVTGGGWVADFDPKDPLVIKLYDDGGQMKYASTGKLRIAFKDPVSLKNGPDNVEVSKSDDVITIKKGDDTITIKKNGAKSMKLEGNVGGKDVTIVFKQ